MTVVVVSDTADPDATVDETYSPTLPALALLLVVVPTMPFVCDGVKLPVDESVVKAPVEVVVAPTLVPLMDPPGIVTDPVKVGDARGA